MTEPYEFDGAVCPTCKLPRLAADDKRLVIYFDNDEDRNRFMGLLNSLREWIPSATALKL